MEPLKESSLLVLLLACLLHPVASNNKIELQFSYVLTPSAVDPVHGVGLESTVPAVDLALVLINNDSNLLPGYSLGYTTVLHSQVVIITAIVLQLRV